MPRWLTSVLVIAFSVWLPVPAAAHQGHSPGGYRWVNAPHDEPSAGTPTGATSTFEVEVEAEGTLSQLVTTADRQLLAVFPPGAFASAVQLVVRPLDPHRLAPPPPGMAFDSNAYEITADAPLRTPFRLSLRYAHLGEQVVVFGGGRWRTLASRNLHQIFQARLDAPTLGAFALVSDAESLKTTSADGGTDVVGVATIAIPVAALLTLIVLGARRRRAR
jgi:hypothetical protein